jgi:hypothetical protein
MIYKNKKKDLWIIKNCFLNIKDIVKNKIINKFKKI